MKLSNEAGRKDRIIFFVLGAVLATITYSIGCYTNEINTLNAEFDIDKRIKEQLGKMVEVDFLKVRHSLTIGKSTGPNIRLYVNENANVEISSETAYFEPRNERLMSTGPRITLVSRDTHAAITIASNIESLYRESGNLSKVPNASARIISGSIDNEHAAQLVIEDDFGEKSFGSLDID